MDTGGVVWLPGSGAFSQFEENSACQYVYGADYYACGDSPDNGGTLVQCCFG
jgi:hypothetical protein